MATCCKTTGIGLGACPHGHAAIMVQKTDGWTEERAPSCCTLCPAGTVLQTYKLHPAPSQSGGAP